MFTFVYSKAKLSCTEQRKYYFVDSGSNRAKPYLESTCKFMKCLIIAIKFPYSYIHVDAYIPTCHAASSAGCRRAQWCVGKIMVPIFRGRCSYMKYLGVEKRSHNLCGQSMYNMAISSYNAAGQLSYFLYQYQETPCCSSELYIAVTVCTVQQYQLGALSITYHLVRGVCFVLCASVA